MDKYEILLATTNRRVSDSFKKVSSSRRIKLDTINTPAKLNKYFSRKGKILEVFILDLTFPTEDLNRFIFYIRQFKKGIPVILIATDCPLVKEKEALRNLSVYGIIKRPSTRSEAEEIMDDLNNILDLDMDKKLEKVDYLAIEKVFACTFKNGRTYFLRRKDIPGDDSSIIKNYVIDEDKYYFTVYLQSGKEYIVLWDFILSMCEERYKFYKNREVEKISSIEIGKRIRNERKTKGFKQKDLANKTGILRANIARIESGKHNPSLETLDKIAKVLKVPVASFLAKER